MIRERITEHYKIQDPVAFVDVFTKADVRLFVLPTAVRRSANAWNEQAAAKISSFSQEIIRCRLSPDPLDARKGRRLLQQGLGEPKETRLGYSVSSNAGHGWGPKLGLYLWNELNIELCRESLLDDLEHLPLFIPHVERDLISDMTTRIIYQELVDFTQAMMSKHSELQRGARNFRYTFWDSDTRTFRSTVATLPRVAGRALLLVPTSWVSPTLLLKPSQYYNQFTTSAIQSDRTKYVGRTKYAPSKQSLHSEFPRIRVFNTEQTLSSAHRGIHLVNQYEKFVSKSLEGSPTKPSLLE